MTTKRYVCPNCEQTEGLRTLESLYGACLADFEQDDAGNVVTEFPDGYTDVFWDSSVTVGVDCRSCGWQYEGTDWPTKLTKTIDVEEVAS